MPYWSAIATRSKVSSAAVIYASRCGSKTKTPGSSRPWSGCYKDCHVIRVTPRNHTPTHSAGGPELDGEGPRAATAAHETAGQPGAPGRDCQPGGCHTGYAFAYGGAR